MKRLINLLFPNRCRGCMRIIPAKQIPLCVSCFQSLPYTHWVFFSDNPAYQLLREHADIKAVSALLFFDTENIVGDLIHHNKYFNQPQIGEFIGNLASPSLPLNFFDAVVAVPSHSRTLNKRGYNQVSSFAKTLSQNIGAPYLPHLIKRTKKSHSQTHKNKQERFDNLKGAFEVEQEIQKIKKILIVDDVLTTGATLSSCCQTIEKNSDAEIYVYVMARAI